MRTGSDAIAIAVFTKTASAPSSIASQPRGLVSLIPGIDHDRHCRLVDDDPDLVPGLEPTIASDRRS